MSTANTINKLLIDDIINKIITYSSGENIVMDGQQLNGIKRNFTESIELQVSLKDYDITRDKRFSGILKLPSIIRPNMKICVIGNQYHCDEADRLGISKTTIEDLKKFNKDQKLIKKFARQYDAFIVSDNLVKQIPRILGPGLTRAGKFPSVLETEGSLREKIGLIKSSIKFQMRKTSCMNTVVGTINDTPAQLLTNILLSINFLISLLKRGLSNIDSIHIKSTMGPAFKIFV